MLCTMLYRMVYQMVYNIRHLIILVFFLPPVRQGGRRKHIIYANMLFMQRHIIYAKYVHLP